VDSREDPDKSIRGIVVGVLYDSIWTWSIPDETRSNIIRLINEILASDRITARKAKSLCGKLVYIKNFIPAGRFNICHIMRLAITDPKADPNILKVHVSPECKKQLAYWRMLLKVCPSPNKFRPMPWAKQLYTDAAGGSAYRIGGGTGGVCGPWWFYNPWTKKINNGTWKVDGMEVGKKVSALELIGPLIAIAAGYEVFTNSCVTCYVDNAGSVAIWRKGYSTRCRLTCTIVTTIAAVAAAIGCTLHVEKIGRCSTTDASVADALSKGRFRDARNMATAAGCPLNPDPVRIPDSLLRWLRKPCPSDDLADQICSEIVMHR
jgi:hypothetical protein